MESIVHELGVKVVRVQVDEIRGEAFIASVFLQVGQRTARIDARPSDGIALALGNALPVFVARQVLDKAGMSPDALDEPGEHSAQAVATRTYLRSGDAILNLRRRNQPPIPDAASVELVRCG
jgi:bifunctional DNase/RNase